MAHVTATITEMRFVGNNSHVCYDNLRNSLSADFRSKLLFKEGLPCSKKETLPWSLNEATIFEVYFTWHDLPVQDCQPVLTKKARPSPKKATESQTVAIKHTHIQMRNQLGTPGGAKSFLRVAQIF